MIKSSNEFDRDTVVIDPIKCVGCGECIIACKKKTYDAITSASANFGGEREGNDD